MGCQTGAVWGISASERAEGGILMRVFWETQDEISFRVLFEFGRYEVRQRRVMPRWEIDVAVGWVGSVVLVRWDAVVPVVVGDSDVRGVIVMTWGWRSENRQLCPDEGKLLSDMSGIRSRYVLRGWYWMIKEEQKVYHQACMIDAGRWKGGVIDDRLLTRIDLHNLLVKY